MNDGIKEMTNKIKKCLIAGYDLDTITLEEMNTLWNYATTLQEENETLKELNVCVGCNNNPDYKTRIDKAIEYIEEHIKYECDNAFNGMQFYSYHLYDFSKNDLLNILQGDKNE